MRWHRLTRTTLALCAATILTIGSISSTSGAKADTICGIEPPGTAEQALASLERRTGPVPYIEEIYHPALLAPRTTRGNMEVAKNGDLVRRQKWPSVEESRIGENFVTIIKNQQPNLLPIPDQLQPWLTTLRAILEGGEFPPQIVSDYSTEDNFWRFDYVVDQPTGERISLLGCGPELVQIELTQPDQTRRVLIFRIQ